MLYWRETNCESEGVGPMRPKSSGTARFGRAARETSRVEFKSAERGLPRSVWQTYSSFANSHGGVIVLGVREGNPLVFGGVPGPDRCVKEFWDTVGNASKVSANILVDADVSILGPTEAEAVVRRYVDVGDGLWDVADASARAVVITVPQVESSLRPVFVGENPFTGSYRRNGEGDYRCTAEEVRAMVRDAGAGSSDRKVLANIGLDALCDETVRAFRNEMHVVRPGHVWGQLGAEEFLMRVGAVGRAPEDRELHPTRAGLLMFGQAWAIADEYPSYFMEYRETEPGRRWEDRIVTGDGEWSGNVFDFFRRVEPRLGAGVRKPFALGEDMRRVEDAPLRVALREGLANALIHADYYGPANTVVTVSPDAVTFSNPGTLLLPAEVIEGGGVSRPRNATVAAMFNLLAIGERAGSGFDAMRRGCASVGLPDPVLTESLSLGQVTLTISLASGDVRGGRAVARARGEVTQEGSGEGDERGVGRGALPETFYVDLGDEEGVWEVVLSQVDLRGFITREEVQHLLGVGKNKASTVIASMVEGGKLRKVGNGRTTRYRCA